MNKNSYVYILCSKRNGTLYIGVTSDLIKQIWQHKNKVVDGFTKKYDVNKLCYFEIFNDITTAINREKELKKLRRQEKLDLIETHNPEWIDLYYELIN